MSAATLPGARADLRRLAWPFRFPRLWCGSCQAFGSWRQTEAGLHCRACGRLLIAAEGGAA